MDAACGHPVVCALLLIADISTGIQYQTNIPAQRSGSYVTGSVNYEVHSGDYGYFYVATGLEISNSTHSVFSITDVSFDNTRLQPQSTILVNPEQTIVIPAKFIVGSSMLINLRSPIYNPISLSVFFP